jgi:hypothetical protein
VTYARDCIIFSCILLISTTVVWSLVQIEKKTYTHEFFKDFNFVHVFFQIALETILLGVRVK